MIYVVKSKTSEKTTFNIAILGLILNILVFPGLGSMVGGRIKTGVIQFILMIVSILLDITIIGLLLGLPLGFGIWIWSLVTSIQVVQDSQR